MNFHRSLWGHTTRDLRVHVFWDPDPDPDPSKAKFLDPGPDPDPPKRKFLDPDPARTRSGPGPGLNPRIFSLIFSTFCVYDQTKNRDFSDLLVTERKKVNIKLFLVVFHHIVLFKFEVKYRPGPKLNLYMDPDPTRTRRKRKKLDPDPDPDPAGSGSGPGLARPAGP